MTLLEKFTDPELLQQLPWAEKALAVLPIIIIGMVLTFVILAIVWFFVALLSRLFGSPRNKEKVMTPTPQHPSSLRSTLEEGGELVAVLTAALAMSLQIAPDTIRVKNIVRMADPTPSWGKMGRIEQFNQRI